MNIIDKVYSLLVRRRLEGKPIVPFNRFFKNDNTTPKDDFILSVYELGKEDGKNEIKGGSKRD